MILYEENSYRSAHHACDEIVLNFCDEPGILIPGESRRMSSAREDVEAMRTLIKKDWEHRKLLKQLYAKMLHTTHRGIENEIDRSYNKHSWKI